MHVGVSCLWQGNERVIVLGKGKLRVPSLFETIRKGLESLEGVEKQWGWRDSGHRKGFAFILRVKGNQEIALNRRAT